MERLGHGGVGRGRQQHGWAGFGRTSRRGSSRLYAFLSQIFDYGNTAIEKRAIFYKRLLPLLEFGREREGVDLSKVVLTSLRRSWRCTKCTLIASSCRRRLIRRRSVERFRCRSGDQSILTRSSSARIRSL